MPDEIERVADRLWARIESDLKGCTTEACQRAREEAEKVYQKTIKEADLESLKELKAYRSDISKLLEELEKARTEVVDIEECPSCKWDKLAEKPKLVGKCVRGCTRINEHEKRLGFKHCPICGDEIDYGEEED